MLRKLVFLFFMASGVASATTVTATLTDSDSQTWNNCKWSAILVAPNNAIPTIGNVPVITTTASGTCSSSGVLTSTLQATSVIDQTGTVWTFTISPNASSGYSIVSSSVAGSSTNLSATLSAGLIAPRFNSGPSAFGYLDVEVKTPVAAGARYFNVTGGCVHSFTVSGWLACTGGSSYNPASVAITGGTINGTTIGATTPAAVTSTINIAGGVKFSVTGCGTATGLTGGSLAGQFTGGSATCTPVVTTGQTSPHGYSCWIQDQTTATALFQQTANTATTITFTAGGVVGATDVINFGCVAF